MHPLLYPRREGQSIADKNYAALDAASDEVCPQCIVALLLSLIASLYLVVLFFGMQACILSHTLMVNCVSWRCLGKRFSSFHCRPIHGRDAEPD